jgi:hypothetical protein
LKIHVSQVTARQEARSLLCYREPVHERRSSTSCFHWSSYFWGEMGEIMKTKFFHRLLYVGATCAGMSLAPIGQAGNLSSTSIYGDPVTISYLGVATATKAGAFLGATFDGGAIPPFWCIDLIDHVAYPPWTYPNYTAAPFQSAPLSFTGTEVSNLETLFSQEYASVASFSSTTDVAAFQLAIWDVLFDTDHLLSTYVGSGGSSFGVVSISDAAAETLAQTWVNNAVTGPQQPYSLTQLTNSSVPPYQSFVFPSPPRETPEPLSLLLAGIALGAMALVLRRPAHRRR